MRILTFLRQVLDCERYGCEVESQREFGNVLGFGPRRFRGEVDFGGQWDPCDDLGCMVVLY